MKTRKEGHVPLMTSAVFELARLGVFRETRMKEYSSDFILGASSVVVPTRMAQPHTSVRCLRPLTQLHSLEAMAFAEAFLALTTHYSDFMCGSSSFA